MATDGITVLLISVVSNPQKYNFELCIESKILFIERNEKKLQPKNQKFKAFFCKCQTSQILQKVRKPPENSSNRRKLSKYYYYLAETEFRTLQYSEPFNFINRNKTSYTKYKQLHYILSSGVFKTIYKVSLFVTFLLPHLGLYKHN